MSQEELTTAALRRVALVAEEFRHGGYGVRPSLGQRLSASNGGWPPPRKHAHTAPHTLSVQGEAEDSRGGEGVRQTSRGAETLNLPLLLILSLPGYKPPNPTFTTAYFQESRLEWIKVKKRR